MSDGDLIDDDVPADGWEIGTGQSPSVEELVRKPTELRRRFFACLLAAEREFGLPFDPRDDRVLERLDIILKRALAGRLSPQLYEFCWQLRALAAAA